MSLVILDKLGNYVFRHNCLNGILCIVYSGRYIFMLMDDECFPVQDLELRSIN